MSLQYWIRTPVRTVQKLALNLGDRERTISFLKVELLSSQFVEQISRRGRVGAQPNAMKKENISNLFGRRSFLKGLAMTGVSLVPASALLNSKAKADPGDASGMLAKADAAMLRFLAAAEILESDLWEQYWELGGVPFWGTR